MQCHGNKTVVCQCDESKQCGKPQIESKLNMRYDFKTLSPSATKMERQKLTIAFQFLPIGRTSKLMISFYQAALNQWQNSIAIMGHLTLCGAALAQKNKKPQRLEGKKCFSYMIWDMNISFIYQTHEVVLPVRHDGMIPWKYVTFRHSWSELSIDEFSEIPRISSAAHDQNLSYFH